MSLRDEKETLVKYMRKISVICRTFTPDLTVPDITPENLEPSLRLLKRDILSLRSSVKKHTLPHCCVSILYQLTSLVLDDWSLAGNFLNTLVYIKPVLYAVNMITPAHEDENLLDAMDHATRARSLLKFRKRNLKNNSEDVDSVVKINFLNRLDQLDRDLMILRDLTIMEISRADSITERMTMLRRQMSRLHITMTDMADTSFSSCSSLNTSEELGENNNVQKRNGEKEKRGEVDEEEEEEEEEEILSELITNY